MPEANRKREIAGNGPQRALDTVPLIDIRNLTVTFGDTRILRGIDLAIEPGESVGLIGGSGSGKSITWLAAMGLLPKTAQIGGSVLLRGSEILGAPRTSLERLRGGTIGIVFQDAAAALNPVRSVGWQIAEVLQLHRGMVGQSAQDEAKRLLDLVGIPEARRRLGSYPFELSGGQNQRVMIAMALAAQPAILIADEPTTGLDVTIQAQILDLLRTLRRETGMALVMISHDLGVISDVCERTYVMDAGMVVEEISVRDLHTSPKHSYTKRLVAAAPAWNLGGHLTDHAESPGPAPVRAAIENAA
ncbi:ABC transporter ATP-binding protein [Mesorhizobium sp. IRAMC:0171]|uniref:ABC transporter ATP-binding protein n=2 Tax=Mesorhizobium retamae TaxID=2912854 RepID=A0ABS9QM35_9HYPH|nr:ABC transporter ATP-binding protein [Mesorhizobium sp. IRAMC:0171]MCG7508509.1 ABC transporter ATP-binding protein [Mesorhizobium sp. IRAMC:0171]